MHNHYKHTPFRFKRFFFGTLVILAIGGLVFLANWEIPAPSKRVEKTISTDNFSN